jgi:ribosome-binding factor A
MSRRTDRLASVIRAELMSIIQRDLHDPRLMGLPSITRVKVAEDLSVADVFITVMGTPGQQTAALNALKHSAGLMRTRLTKALSIRTTPFIQFHMDEDLKKELEMMELLDKVAKENAELDRKRAEAAAAAERATPEADAASDDEPEPRTLNPEP